MRLKHLVLRPLDRAEQQTLKAKIRDLSLCARVHQRYRVIDQVPRSYTLSEAADRVGCHSTVADDWVHRFSQSGFSTFEQVSNPKGRPPILRAGQLRELVEVALSNPQERGLPFSPIGRCQNWRNTAGPGICCLLSRMNGYAACCGARGLRRNACARGRHPRIRTSIGKKLIRRLYRECPQRATVLCFDQWARWKSVPWAVPRGRGPNTRFACAPHSRGSGSEPPVSSAADLNWKGVELWEGRRRRVSGSKAHARSQRGHRTEIQERALEDQADRGERKMNNLGCNKSR